MLEIEVAKRGLKYIIGNRWKSKVVLAINLTDYE